MAEAAQAGFEIVDRPESWGLPVVEGHQVTLSEQRAFHAYFGMVGSEANRVKVAARAGGVSIKTIREWRRRSWWKVLFERHVEDAQEEFHAELLSMHSVAVRGLRRVLEGHELPSGSASAIVRGTEMLTKIGKKPLQDSRNITTVNQMNLDNRGGTIISGKTLEEIEDQETMMKVITGEYQLAEE